MPTINPRILEDAQAAAPATPLVYTPESEGPEALTLAAQRGSGYRVLYSAINGCGGVTHNFNNLRRLQNSGVDVQYVNSNPAPDRMPVSGNPAGRQINNSFAQGAALLERYGLSVFSSDVLLIDPNNRVIGRFDSRQGNFVSSVLARIPAQARGQSL